ncbi:MAG: D-alanyl-D-alanine carboxypeptidase/D-alanyl-D-alanine-endopeptidase, partial [Campylobacterales bacterium]|nr:D-alanyl-D-alanine carboxypeptidase/D-alanyl-D-alanine-endopeptidase [Campylobacterales bacterium]
KLISIIVLTSFIYASLPSGIEAILAKYPIPRSAIAIDIRDAHSGISIASHNEEAVMSPASVIKVLTTYSALLHLGFDYRWSTLFYYTGEIRNGTLYGDLVIKPHGDPNLNSKNMVAIAQKIQSKGINRIMGDIVIDRSFFNIGNQDTSGFDENIYSPYNAMPDSMMFNERVTTLHVTPQNGEVVVESDVNDKSFKIINHATVTGGSCVGSRAWPQIKINKEYEQPLVMVSGSLSSRCPTIKIKKVITKPYKTFYYALKDALNSLGVSNQSGLKLSNTPHNAKALFVYKSRTLEESVSIINKDSNNVLARQLMLTLGAYIYNRPSTLHKSRQAIKDILAQYNIELDSCYIDNGCGLSRVSTIKASDLTKVLLSAYTRYGQRWLNTFSVAGVDGTAKRRFRNSNVHAKGWFKTGTIKHVKNIIGYTQTNSGKLYSIVILVNHQKAGYGAAMQNDVIKWVAENY